MKWLRFGNSGLPIFPVVALLGLGTTCVYFLSKGVLSPALEVVFALLLAPSVFYLVVFLLASAYLRLVVFVGMSLLVMQSDGGALAALKPILLAFMGLSAILSIVGLRRLPIEVRRGLRALLFGCGLLSVTVVVFMFYSVFQGESLDRVVRDATTYLMVAIGPVIAAEAAIGTTVRRAHSTVGFFASAAAVSFAVFWLSARGVGNLGLERVGMFSFLLTSLGFVTGLVYGMVRKNALWFAVSLVSALGVLVTGTRTGLLMSLGLVGLVGRARYTKIRLSRLLGAGAIVVLGIGFLLPAVGSLLASETFISARMSMVGLLFTNGIEADNSGAMRAEATDITLGIWGEHPLMGVGFGHAFPSVDANTDYVDFQLDSWALVLGKFGSLGSLLLVLAIGLIFAGLLRMHRHTGIRVGSQMIARGFLAICIGLLVLGWPPEDKGFALSMALITWLVIVETLRARSAEGLQTAQLYDMPSKKRIGRLRGGIQQPGVRSGL